MLQWRSCPMNACEGERVVGGGKTSRKGKWTADIRKYARNVCKQKKNPLHTCFPFFVAPSFAATSFPFFFLRSFSQLEYFSKLFQYHAQFEKTLCVKKGNKNNIIHIYTSSNRMCVCVHGIGIEFVPRWNSASSKTQNTATAWTKNEKRMKPPS